MNRGTWIGYALAVLLVVPTIAWGILSRESPTSLNLLIAVAGALIGWVVGMLTAPVSKTEEKKFPEYGKAISTFAAGYLAAKADKLFELYFASTEAMTELLMKRTLIFVCAFLLGT